MRPHIAFLIGIAYFANNQMQHWDTLRTAIEKMSSGQQTTLGLTYHKDNKGESKKYGWHMTRATTQGDNDKLLKAALALASCQVGSNGVTTVRYGKNPSILGPLHGFTQSEIWIWVSTSAHGGWHPVEPPLVFEAHGNDLHR